MCKTIIAIIIIIFILFVFSKIDVRSEHLTDITNEAVQNLASVYNKKSIQVNDVSATTVTSTTFNGALNGPVSGTINATGCALTLGKVTCDKGDCGNCRALSKSDLNTLVINNGNDFKGGVRIDSPVVVTGRDILKELDGLQAQINSIKSNYVPFNRNVSSKPINDFGRCFDFGSDGRTGCDNGWSIVQIIPR